MNPEVAKNILTKVLFEGRIIINNLPLTMQELQGVQASIAFLYNQAKEYQETKSESKPPQGGGTEKPKMLGQPEKQAEGPK